VKLAVEEKSSTAAASKAVAALVRPGDG